MGTQQGHPHLVATFTGLQHTQLAVSSESCLLCLMLELSASLLPGRCCAKCSLYPSVCTASPALKPWCAGREQHPQPRVGHHLAATQKPPGFASGHVTSAEAPARSCAQAVAANWGGAKPQLGADALNAQDGALGEVQAHHRHPAGGQQCQAGTPVRQRQTATGCYLTEGMTCSQSNF